MRLTLAVLLLATLVEAQEPKRPRIALALEGGAALGFAHIGVLEWPEANRIPIDAIAGTSMGGLIGGLYAAGYTPAEIRRIADSAEWDKLLSGETSFRELAYRRKEDRIAFPNRIELGVNGGLSLPSGFNEGHQIGLLLSRLTLAYPSLKSFDELPTPFRCVSTELVSGTARVWQGGLLNEALRSTMSIPAVFSPVRKDSGIYVDGGLLDNLPVEIAKKMDADLVIAVHLSKGPVDPKSIGSLVDVFGRSISVVIGAAEMRTIALADVVLVAELGKYSTTDYTKNAEIADVGRAAAESKANVLRRFALDEAGYEKFLAARQARTRKIPMDPPKFISVIGPEADTNESLRQKLTQLTDLHANSEEFEQELTKIVGYGRYASLGYQQSLREGEQGLEITATPKTGGPIFLTPGFEINGIDSSDTRFSLGSRITWLDLFGFRSELRSDLWFGSRFGASLELYQPLRPNSRFFVAPRVYVDSNPFDFYFENRPLSTYRLRQQGASFDTGIAINRFSELRLGYQFNWINARQRIGPPIFDEVRGRRDGVSLRYRYEGQDDAIVARRGSRIFARTEYFPDSGNTIAEFRGLHMQRVSAQNSLIMGLSAGATCGPAQSLFLSFPLGGPALLGAYGLNEILAREYTIGSAGFLHEVKSQPSLLGSKVFLLGVVQAARTRDIFADQRYPASGTGAIVLRTLFGPVFIGGSVGDRGHRR